MTPLNIVVVNWDNYLGRGDEYVERMREGLNRHIHRPFKFRVVTKADVPEGVEGWWCKLWLFSAGAFPAGERVLFFDLDLVPMGSLDFLADYRGPFTGLRDWYYPNSFGSAIMSWEAGTLTDIWEKWEECGRPLVNGGDQRWIWMMRPETPKLQDMFPGRFAPYKIKPAIMCYHGSPRPHETGWATTHIGDN
jgi:hypothetical protein